MQLPIYQVDAFTDRLFGGNPAAVCPLDRWLPDTTMQAIAAENNLSETAFFVAADQGFHLRWFTPTTEVDLCGHATLAAAFVLFHCLGHQQPRINFITRSGLLRVTQDGGDLTMDFPAATPTPCPAPAAIVQAFGTRPQACLRAEDYLVVMASEQQVRAASPDLARLDTLDRRGVIITAPSDHPDTDFVSRFFAPKYGIDEDPVTGSAHTQLVPYWATRLAKGRLNAKQLSARGGTLRCALDDQRVAISGNAVLYLRGTITV